MNAAGTTDATGVPTRRPVATLATVNRAAAPLAITLSMALGVAGCGTTDAADAGRRDDGRVVARSPASARTRAAVPVRGAAPAGRDAAGGGAGTASDAGSSDGNRTGLDTSDGIAGAGTAPPAGPADRAATTTLPPLSGGAYFAQDGPGSLSPTAVAALAVLDDPRPAAEPLAGAANRPYQVLGRSYVPMTRRTPVHQRGVASWYGRMFHGRRTSIGERYDMYSMSAAHPTFPLPSYARVTNRANGRSVVVRVNDRGPFLQNRTIDLSLMAAYKLGYAAEGRADVDVELLATPEAGPVDGNAGVTAGASTGAGAGAGAGSIPGVAGAGEGPGAVARTGASTGAGAAARAVVAAGTATTPAPAPAPGPTDDAVAALDAFPAEPPRDMPRPDPYFVQLAAFSERARADAAHETLQRRLATLGQPVRLAAGDGVYRLRLGPFDDRAEAHRVAQQVRSLAGPSGAPAPIVVPAR